MTTDLLDRSIRLKPKRGLTPDDFKAQLYIVVNDIDREITARVEVAWGQQMVICPVIREGIIVCVGVYDRPEGGDPVLDGIIKNYAARCAYPADSIVLVSIEWP